MSKEELVEELNKIMNGLHSRAYTGNRWFDKVYFTMLDKRNPVTPRNHSQAAFIDDDFISDMKKLAKKIVPTENKVEKTKPKLKAKRSQHTNATDLR